MPQLNDRGFTQLWQRDMMHGIILAEWQPRAYPIQQDILYIILSLELLSQII